MEERWQQRRLKMSYRGRGIDAQRPWNLHCQAVMATTLLKTTMHSNIIGVGEVAELMECRSIC